MILARSVPFWLRLGHLQPAHWIGAGILAASFALPMPAHGRICGLPTVCLFHMLTGRPCPGCGLTRSFVYFAHGKWSQAVAYHPLGPALFIACALYVVCGLLQLKVLALSPKKRARFQRCAGYVVLALVLGVWIVRVSGLLPIPPDL